MSFLHRLWRLIPPGPRRRAMYEIGARFAPKITRTPRRFDGTIGVVGELGRHSGLGIAARIMAEALARCGATVSTFDIGTLTDPRRLTQGERERLAQVSTLAIFVNAPQLPIALRRIGRRHITDQRIVGCWAWELPTMPPIWRAGLRSVHEIWAPSHFTGEALGTIITENVRLPVTVIPHPLASAPPKPSRLGRSAFGLPEGPVIVFACFSLASSFARKNPLGAIAAFREAFGVRSDRLLVLKISDADSHPDDMAIIRDAVANARNIRLETHDLSGPDLHALMAASDIILSLHRSEGFGLVPAEAMMLSRAVVATDWSATAEWLDTECGLPVRYRLIPAKDQRGVFEARNAFWADPDIGDAAAQLRRAADDPDLRARLGMAAAKRANHAFGTASLQARLAGLAS